MPTGTQGAAGASAYQVWLDAGNSGTVDDFFDFLTGDQGDPGQNATVETGSGAPINPPVSNPDAGAIYLDSDPGGNYWIWDGSSWTDTGIQVQGPQGDAGDDGQNSFATLNSAFNQPAVNANVFIQTGVVGGFSWMVPGQNIFIEGGGYYEVVSTFNGGGGTDTNANVTNLGYEANSLGFSGNAAPGAAISIGAKVSPAGIIGPAGEDSTVAGPVGPPPNVFFTAAFDNSPPAEDAGIQIVNSGAGAGDVYLWDSGGSSWDGPYNINGSNGTLITNGPELPNSLAPNVGNVDDYRFYIPGDGSISLYQKIDNTPTWNQLWFIGGGSGSSDQTFTAIKTADQALPAANTNTVVLVENDSTGAGRDPAGVWNGSVCTFIADAPTLRVAAEGFTIARPSGTQTISFTGHIYHRPLSTGIDVSIGSATLAFTGAAETSLTAAVIASSDVTPLLGDQLRFVVDPSTTPTNDFRVVSALRLYTQSV